MDNKLAALVTYTVAANYAESVRFSQNYGQTSDSSNVQAVEASVRDAIKAGGSDALEEFLQLHPDQDLFDCGNCLGQPLAATGGLTSLEPALPIAVAVDSPAPLPKTQYFTRDRMITIAAVVVALALAIFLSIRFS